MTPAGFWVRLAAYLIDIAPIAAAVAAVFYSFLGFDVVIERHRARPGDVEAQAEFVLTRHLIRNLSLALYLGYAGLLEASPLRGTFGKWLLGLEVVDAAGDRLSPVQAARRNFLKPVSFLPFGLGCLRVAWSRDKLAWHDQLSGTAVVHRRASPQVWA